jgi:hypothetical protein
MRVDGVNAAHARVLERTFKAGGAPEPISVAQIGKALWAVDGFHRLHAARGAGLETISANVARMSLEEARDFALLANTKHGKRLTPRDKDRIFSRYVELGRHLDAHGAVKACRTIADELDHIISHETARKKLKALGVELDMEVEFPGGYTPWGGGVRDEAELAVEIEGEAWEALDGFRSAMVALELDARQELLVAARKLVEALERGEQPEPDRMEPENPLGI